MISCCDPRESATRMYCPRRKLAQSANATLHSTLEISYAASEKPALI